MIDKIYKKFFDKIELHQAIYQVKKNGFWFVDIPRTSSSSIKIELTNAYGKVYGKQYLIEKNYTLKKSPFKDHLTAIEMKQILGEKIWDEIFTFTLVRNPWDRIVSFYFYRKKRGNLPDEVSFRDYVLQFNSPRYKRAKSLHSLPLYYYGLAEYILDKNDKIIVDFVGKYENRETDIKTIAQRLNCPSLGHLFLQKAKPLEMHYSQFYDEETKNIIGRVFAQDIELFGYRFES